jgi:hypothetical protein
MAGGMQALMDKPSLAPPEGNAPSATASWKRTPITAAFYPDRGRTNK